MESNWVNCELGDFIELKRGYDLPKTKRIMGEVPVVSSSGISGEHNEIKIRAPGVVTGRYGTIGEVFYIEDDFWPLNTTLYVKDFKGNDPLYTYYLLKTIRYSDYTDKGAVPGINRNHIHKAKIKIPICPKHQRNLALQLFYLDKKIRLNQQTNQTLEQMAQILFKSWFVDFDPVFDNLLAKADFNLANLENILPEPLFRKAKARLSAINASENAGNIKASLTNLVQNSSPQLSSRSVSEPDAISATILPQHANTHFPSGFEHNEQLGWIPKGWEASDILSCSLKISKGSTPRKKDIEESTGEVNIPFIKVRDISGTGEVDLHNLDTIPRCVHENQLKRSILITNDVLVSIAGTIGRVSFVDNELSGANANQAVAFIRPKKSEIGLYLYEFLKTKGVQSELDSKVVQAVQANVSLTQLGSIQFAQPSSTLLDCWYNYSNEYFSKIISLRKSNRSLTKLRDTLLPKLISGELQIPDEKTP